MTEFLLKYAGELITALIVFLPTYMTSHRKRKSELATIQAELDNEKIDHANSIVDMYKQLTLDLKKEHQEKFDNFKKEYEARFSVMHLEINKLRNDQILWENKYRTLKKEFENYKKNNTKK